MDANKEYITLGYAELDTLGKLNYAPYAAVDVTRACFSELDYDPWELLRAVRAEMTNAPLALTLAGQCLVTDRVMPDDVVDMFVAKAIENGVSELRIYDPLNDPRNLQTAVAAAKRCGAKVYAGMVYSKNPAYSPAFFAGYASQLAALGADGIWLFSMSDEFACRETVTAIKEAVSVPLGVSCASLSVSDIALDSDVDFYENEVCEPLPAEYCCEIERIREDAGYPPLYGFIREIILEQAANNHGKEVYTEVFPRFRNLLLGKYGRTPCPIRQELVAGLCGGEALVLVRPADNLAPELDVIEDEIAAWSEQDEDALTYAVFRDEAIGFFERRNAKRYSLDLPHAHADKGIHTV